MRTVKYVLAQIRNYIVWHLEFRSIRKSVEGSTWADIREVDFMTEHQFIGEEGTQFIEYIVWIASCQKIFKSFAKPSFVRFGTYHTVVERINTRLGNMLASTIDIVATVNHNVHEGLRWLITQKSDFLTCYILHSDDPELPCTYTYTVVFKTPGSTRTIDLLPNNWLSMSIGSYI